VDHEQLVIEASLESAGQRLDKFLCEQEQLFPRSQWKGRDAKVVLKNQPIKPSYKIKGGEVFSISFNSLKQPDFLPEKMDLNILYEDDDLIVINKPQGLVVHPGNGHPTGTLVQGLLYFPQEDPRPGIVHRLDKETSGVILAAKHPKCSDHLIQQFQKKRIKKNYFAITKGQIRPGTGTVEGNMNRDPKDRKKFTIHKELGKPSLTDYQVEFYGPAHSFVRLMPKTGRTHQLRVHMQHLGHPTPITGSYAASGSSYFGR